MGGSVADAERWAAGLVEGLVSEMRPDPQRDAVYAAERESADNWGPHFARIADAQRFVDAVLADPAWVDQFPNAPLDVPVIRRSTSARYSAADVESGAIHLTRAGLCGPIVLHELAHLADHSIESDRSMKGENRVVEPHGSRFVGIHLMLVRRFCGFHAYGDYRAALDRHGVRYEWPVSS